MATLQIRKKGVNSWWHYPSDRQPYFLSRLTCIMFGEYLVIREIRDTTKINGKEIARYHYTDITVYDDTSGGSPETFPNPIALTNRLAELEYVGFEQGGGGVGFQPNISNPQDGQVILYNESTGAWENHYIDSKGDRFLTLGTVEVDGNEITLKPTFSWIIQQSEHSYDVDWVNVVPYTSEEGKFRTDIIVATNAGIFIRIQGEEGDVAVSPAVPENTLLVTSIDVFHDSLGNPEPPIIGSEFVKKMGYNNLYLTGAGATTPVLSENKRNLVILSYTGSNIIDGFKDGMPGQPSTLYQGMIVTVDNQTDQEVPLNDMTSSTNPNSDIKMDFRAGISQYTMKPGEVLTFKLRNSVLVLLSSNKAEVDIEVPTKTSDLTNDGADGTSTYVEHDELADVATSGDYNDLDNLPSLDFIPTSEKGSINGVAELDGTGKVPSSQLPSYVDDVLEFADLASFPVTGESGKIYVALDTNFTYRWSGSAYVRVNEGVVLGETSTTAYRGDRGKTAYDHSQLTGNPHQTTLQQVVDTDGTVTDKPVEFKSATPDTSTVNINNEGVRVENQTDKKAVEIRENNLAFEQDGKKISIEPASIDDDYVVTIQAKTHTLAGLDDILSDAVDIDYDNADSGLTATNVQELGDELQANIEQEIADRQLAIETAGFVQRTGTEIAFDKWAIYNSYSSPADGDISYDLTNAVVGMIQVMYHQDDEIPVFAQAGITVEVDEFDYTTGVVNEIIINYRQPNMIKITINSL